MDDRPLLDGVTVLDLASVGPAVRASRWLADWGADVVKVGPVPRDAGVQIVPPPYAYSAHRGMRRVLLDLKSDGGREAFLRLATVADVVIESFRPGVVDRLGIGHEAVRDRNPGIVYCSTTGYGQSGPRANWAGHDINYLAVGGYLHCTGRDGRGGPALPGATVADSAGGGLQAVAAICAALAARAVTGEGTRLDVSVADGVLSLMSLAVDEYLAEGTRPGPRHGLLTGRYAWYDVYRAADDRWLAVGAIEPHFFANLCRGLGCDRWIDHQYDAEAVGGMRADFAAAFSTRTRDEWDAVLEGTDVCYAPVLAVSEAVEHPHNVARGTFVDIGGIVQPGPAPRLSATPGEVRRPPPHEGQHTDELLVEAGLGDDEVAALRESGAVA